MGAIKLGTRQITGIVTGIFLVISLLVGGSFAVPEKTLTGRRGIMASIPKEVRQWFVDYRTGIGIGGGLLFVLTAGGWFAAEQVSRTWQKRRNDELAANAVLIKIVPRPEDQTRWETVVDMWRGIHSTIARPEWQVWLGGGMHLSFEIVQQAGEDMVFYLWLPRPLAQTITRQLEAIYAKVHLDVQTKKVAEGMDDYFDGKEEGAAWRWADIGLGRESWRPLRTDFAADPIAPLLSSLAGLSPGVEMAALHIIVRPAGDRWRVGGSEFADRVRGDNLPAGQKRPRINTQDRARVKGIEEKGESLGYELCLRVMACGQGAAGENLDRLVRIFDQFGDDNRLVVRQKGNESELYRLRGRFFPAGWGSSVVSERELAAIAHLPNKETTGVPVKWAGVQVERPSPASFVQPGENRIVIGFFNDIPSFQGGLRGIEYTWGWLRNLLKLTDAEPGGGENDAGPKDDSSTDVGIGLIDARRHFHAMGPTGVGKSTLLLQMIHQYMSKFPEASIWLQEPHQDLTHKVIARVPLAREKDVIWLDVMNPKRIIGINPLTVPEGADLGALTADIMGVMRKAMGANWDSAVQMQEVIENSLNAILKLEKQPTMVHLFKLLTNSDYRYDLTSRIEDPIDGPYWESLEMKKEKELDQMFSVPRRRINAFLRNNVVRNIIAQPVSTVNFREAIDTHKIILVQLDSRMGATNVTFIGAVMMYILFGAVMSRMDIPESERKQAAIFVDEFQTFVSQSGDEFAKILEQARKMGASLTLAHQHLGQLTQGGGEMLNSIANNTGTKVIFRAEAADAPQVLRWLPALGKATALTELENYTCYARPLIRGTPHKVCTLKTYADPPIPDPVEELRTAPRGTPDPLPPHPGQAALVNAKRVSAAASDEDRGSYLVKLDEDGWLAYRAGRRYLDALRRNDLIEHPEKLPNKMDRIRELVDLAYGTPIYEIQAQYRAILLGR